MRGQLWGYSMTPFGAGISKPERILLGIVFLLLCYASVFLAMSRLGLLSQRHLLALAVTAVATWAFHHFVLATHADAKRLDRKTILVSCLIIGSFGIVLLVVAAPGYVLPGLDPVIVPTLANAFVAHATTMDVYRLGDPGFAYPPGYPILFSIVSILATPLLALSIFKIGTIILVLLFPIGWAWLAYRIFGIPLPAWSLLLLAYVSVFGLERSVTFSLEDGKNSQILAGAVFPFLVGLLLLATRTNIGIVFAIVAFIGAILLHYSILYMVGTFYVAHILVHPPQKKSDWVAHLRMCFVGLSSLAIFIVMFKPALSDPRAGNFGWPDFADGPRRVASVILAKYDELLFIFNGPSFSNWHRSPYRGLFLVGCAILPLALIWRRKTRSDYVAAARMAGVFGLMCLLGILLGTEAVKAGITFEFVRWYLIFPQSALMLSVLCAIACHARGQECGAGAAKVALGAVAILSLLVAGIDLVHIARTYRAEPITRSDLANVRDVLSNAAPCFLITQSRTVAGDLHTAQDYRPLDYAEFLTRCKILNGSFVQRGITEGRAMAGLPTAAALATLPLEANIYLITPAAIETRYRTALPGFDFVLQQSQIGPLPVWRVRPAAASK